MIENHCRLSRISVLVVLVLLMFQSGVSPCWGVFSPASAGHEQKTVGQVITVCPGGPPTCDHAAIQPALDAAQAGDQVLVDAGTYAGQIALKSGVTLVAPAGPEATTITATEGPIVTAQDVLTATVQGLTISGRDALTGTIGVDLISSNVALTNCVVSDMHGADGTVGAPDGGLAVGIRVRGSGNLIISNFMIQDIAGGDGFQETRASGGDAIGVQAEGELQLIIEQTIIRRVSGGGAGECDGTMSSIGGRATGIQAGGENTVLAVTGLEASDLRGGDPLVCYGIALQQGNAGPVIGLQMSGGSLTVTGSQFSRFTMRRGINSRPSYAISTFKTKSVRLESNTVTDLNVLGAEQLAALAAPSVPVPPWPGTSMIAIASAGGDRLEVVGNTIVAVRGVDVGGQAVGIQANQIREVIADRNTIRDLYGGWGTEPAHAFGIDRSAIGISVNGADRVELTANTIGELGGGSILGPGHDFYRIDGGSVAGLVVSATPDAYIANNIVWSLSGGSGNEVSWDPSFGGYATALILPQGSSVIVNNSFYSTQGGWGAGGNGIGVGISLIGDSDALVLNNVVARHELGISGAHRAMLGYNDLWGNERDYVGVLPGPSDLHVDPAFVDPDSGDFHLQTGSPLIDAGTNASAPPVDFEGEPRPLDGDSSGSARADIGADEYRIGLRYSTKTADKTVAGPGDTLTYELAVVNANWEEYLTGVTLTDTVPAGTRFVTGSLRGSAGVWHETEDGIAWLGDIAPNSSVTLTFSVVVSESLAGPRVIVNEAFIDDRISAPRAIRAMTLVNPMRLHLPLLTK